MKKIGITGQNGFVGTHLYNTLGLFPDEFRSIDFDRSFFDDNSKLDDFVSKCDVIIHLAALNRHESPKYIYDTNIALVEKLIASLERTKSCLQILFSSSLQEANESLYGVSKLQGRILFENWSKKSGNTFTGLIIPNVFGPFGKPYYNSVVATFCTQIVEDKEPEIKVDGDLNLIYIGELINVFLDEIRNPESKTLKVQHTKVAKVSDLLDFLKNYKEVYQLNGEIPILNNQFELNLFNTFRSYIDHKEYFPVKTIKHTDSRGSFVEIIRHGIGGQTSFSTTEPNIVRGNHYHTRKIERFFVIKGKALIQLRKIGTDKVLEFYLDGEVPSYVDMPIWYTHNIKNIGDEILYTNFWINEPYNANDPDTYFEEV